MDLTDEQSMVFAPLIVEPQRQDRRGRPRRDAREVLNGMLWVLRTRAQWADLTLPALSTMPSSFSGVGTKQNGTFENILQA